MDELVTDYLSEDVEQAIMESSLVVKVQYKEALDAYERKDKCASPDCPDGLRSQTDQTDQGVHYGLASGEEAPPVFR